MVFCNGWLNLNKEVLVAVVFFAKYTYDDKLKKADITKNSPSYLRKNIGLLGFSQNIPKIYERCLYDRITTYFVVMIEKSKKLKMLGVLLKNY